jgi:hypothetical protein
VGLLQRRDFNGKNFSFAPDEIVRLNPASSP